MRFPTSDALADVVPLWSWCSCSCVNDAPAFGFFQSQKAHVVFCWFVFSCHLRVSFSFLKFKLGDYRFIRTMECERRVLCRPVPRLGLREFCKPVAQHGRLVAEDFVPFQATAATAATRRRRCAQARLDALRREKGVCRYARSWRPSESCTGTGARRSVTPSACGA